MPFVATGHPFFHYTGAMAPISSEPLCSCGWMLCEAWPISVSAFSTSPRNFDTLIPRKLKRVLLKRNWLFGIPNLSKETSPCNVLGEGKYSIDCLWRLGGGVYSSTDQKQIWSYLYAVLQKEMWIFWKVGLITTKDEQHAAENRGCHHGIAKKSGRCVHESFCEGWWKRRWHFWYMQVCCLLGDRIGLKILEQQQ